MLTLFFTFFSTISVVFAQSTTGPTAAMAPLPPHEGQFEIRGEFDYLSSGSNYLSNGSNSNLIYGKFNTYTGMGQFSYDFNSQFRAMAGLSGGQTSTVLYDQANSYATASTITYTQTVMGVNDFWLGGQFWYRNGGLSIVPQGELVYPFFRINNNSTNTLYGEGAMELKAGSWLMYRVHEFTPYGYIGYSYRDQGRSALAAYDLGARYAKKNMFWLAADFHGFGSISSDSNTAYKIGRENYLIQVDGGSLQYYAINPSRANLGLSGGLDFDGLGVYAAADFTVFGQEAANYWSVIVGLTFRGSMTGEPRRRQDGFSPKSDPYDSSLFRENAVPKEPVDPEDQNVTARPEPKPRPRVQRARSQGGADAPEPSVELLMKDTEQTLDTKTK